MSHVEIILYLSGQDRAEISQETLILSQNSIICWREHFKGPWRIYPTRGNGESKLDGKRKRHETALIAGGYWKSKIKKKQQATPKWVNHIIVTISILLQKILKAIKQNIYKAALVNKIQWELCVSCFSANLMIIILKKFYISVVLHLELFSGIWGICSIVVTALSTTSVVRNHMIPRMDRMQKLNQLLNNFERIYLFYLTFPVENY